MLRHAISQQQQAFMEDDFIKEDEGSDEEEAGNVDEIINKLSEEHKVIQEQQANITALRSAGIHRPTTPGYKTQYDHPKHLKFTQELKHIFTYLLFVCIVVVQTVHLHKPLV